MSVHPPATVERLIAARQSYFEHGLMPNGVIDDIILRSWTRCAARTQRERDTVAFEPVDRSMLGHLTERNIAVLTAAKVPVHDLAKAVAGAGYAILLTDARGYALSVAGAVDASSPVMRQAFRPGVNLSESAIGTSAMACAIDERRAVRVSGPEHYFAANQVFSCAAAPILSPDGELLGTIDITRDSPERDLGALSLVGQCAQAVERDLFRRWSAHLTIDLSWTASLSPGQQSLILAFGADGEVVAANENVRRFIGMGDRAEALRFEDIFEGRFGDYAGGLRDNVQPQPLRLRSGLCLFASSAHFQRHTVSGTSKRTRPFVAPAVPEPPEFGDSAINRQIAKAARAVANHLPVLILGETGTGKDKIAATLHAMGGHADRPFVAINCAAIPENLIEGELFGHVDGAYTGARRGGAPGKIEMAHGGTLFLDEIGDMPPSLQARLLRVLENREVCRLGSATPRRVDFQLISATHQDLPQFIPQGRFREDLYYRINGFMLSVPPVRSRSDFPALVRAILAEVSMGERGLSAKAMASLRAYPWPGNVRELKHMLTYAHAFAEPGAPLSPADFPIPAQTPLQAPHHAGGLLGSLEENAIRQALRHSAGNVASAAELLGISRATLYRRIRGSGSLHR